MVQKYQSPVRVYKYPFELVMAAYERRFPKCPQMPIVLDCEVIEDDTLEGGARRETKRRCKLAVDAPYLFKKLIGLDHVFFIQHNSLDMRARTLNIEATNETFSTRIEIFERCRYYAHPDNNQWTCFDQTATLDIKNFFGFEHSMEKMGMKQYTQTTLKGKEIIEFFINQLKAEGITQVPRWSDNTNGGGTVNASTNCNNNGHSDGGSQMEAVAQMVGASPKASEAVEARNKKEMEATGGLLNAAENEGEKKRDAVPGGGRDFQLDEDYIAKYLGELTPLQESKLLELETLIKQAVSEGEIVTKPDHQAMLRFLRARDYHVDKAYAMLIESLKWRRENEIDKLLQLYKMPAVIAKHFPGGWHHYDNDGRPCYVLRLGHMDVKGLLKSVGEEGLLRLTLHICEEGLRLMQESTKELERAISTWCLLVDLEGLSMRHLWRPGVRALLRIIETVERNYPETMGRVLIVRAPRVFPILWTLISTFIDENTRSKFLFYGSHNCMHPDDGLERYIPPEIIPDFLGGPCTTLIHEGGLVPKNLYKTIHDHEHEGNVLANDNPHVNQDMYKAVEVKPGQCFEVVLKNNDLKSVLTWDFDVLNADIQFTVLRTTATLKSRQATTTTTTTGVNGEVNDNGVAHDESILGWNKLNEEGVDYVKVEPTVMCHPKESVQGSHVMDAKGTYLLQWLCPTTVGTPGQLLYYYEVLSSESYRGSMTSLQSGFSALSGASSCQSR